MNKNTLRQVVREQKRQFSGEQLRELSLSICQTLLSHSAIKQANTILLYASLPDEVQTNTLLATLLEQKKRILLPVVVNETSLELREYKGKEELETGAPHAYKIGIAFPFQIFSSIPVTSHDIKMNEVIYQ